jgi:Tol biopolymer transport system component
LASSFTSANRPRSVADNLEASQICQDRRKPCPRTLRAPYSRRFYQPQLQLRLRCRHRRHLVNLAPGRVNEPSASVNATGNARPVPNWKTVPIIRQDLSFYFATSGSGGWIPIDDSLAGQCPAWSPRFDRVAFSNNEYWFPPSGSYGRPAPTEGIYVADRLSGRARQLTHGLDDARRWSPDGNRILFTRFENRSHVRIEVLDLLSRRITTVTPPTEADGHPSWSPNGRTIAYTSVRPDGWTIVLQDLNTNRHRTVPNLPPGHCDFARWSPDGRKLLFQCLRTGTMEDFSLYTVRPDGTDLHRLRAAHVIGEPASWSPDGTHIAYVAYTAREAVAIFVCDASGHHVRQVHPAAGVLANSDYWPDW